MKPRLKIETKIKNREGEIIKGIYREFGMTYCFVCGSKKKKLTRHHLLPKCLKPCCNVVVPLCLECHRLVHNLIIEDANHKDGEF